MNGDPRVYHASQLGYCIKRQVAEQMDYTRMPPPQKMQAVYDGGHQWEAVVKDHLLTRGFDLEDRLNLDECPDCDRGEHVELVVSDGAIINGHLDGRLEGRVLEVKSMAHDDYERFVARGWEMGGLMERYKWQVSVYMLATGLELALVGVDKTSSPDNPVYHTVYAEIPFYNLIAVRSRVLLIDSFSWLPDCDDNSYPCPFWYLGCGLSDIDESDDALEALASLVTAQDDVIKAEKAKGDVLRKQLLADMGQRKKVRTEVATVSITTKTSNYLDEEAMRCDGIDLDKYRKTKEGAKYVRLTRRKNTGTDAAGDAAAGTGSGERDPGDDPRDG